MESRKAHLVGAYGMFWDRSAVNWSPGSGRHAWQLLGFVNRNKPKIRVCDFRSASGFYVLFDDFRATYAGLAGGRGGIGGRLKAHTKDSYKRWNRFCWFSFADVADINRTFPGWCELKPRDALKSSSASTVLRESEALLIAILGLQDQNEMRFARAKKWQQLTKAEFVNGGVGRKVDSSGYTDLTFFDLATSAITHAE